MTFRPICVPCAREMRCRKNDSFFKDYDAAAIWAGDRYECEGCKASVIVGVAREPVILAGERKFDDYAALAAFELTRD